MKYPIADVPDEKTLIQHVKENSDFVSCATEFKNPFGNHLLKFELPAPLFQALKASAEKAIEKFGLYGWLTSEGREKDSSYQSLSLTYNPNLSDPGIDNVHQSSLGNSVYKKNEIFYNGTKKFSRLKNTYFDTYAFRLPTPAARLGALGDFIDACGLSLIRSRLSVIYGDRQVDVNFDAGWHKDECVHENLRLNIPLISDDVYRLQVEPHLERPQHDSSSMQDYFLRPGCAYTFDTHLPHRAYATGSSNIPRVHLVLGFSPWLTYVPNEEIWAENDFYGGKHPFHILSEGLLHPALNGVQFESPIGT